MFQGCPVIDMHAHLRNGKYVVQHAKLARKYGIDALVAMANTQPCNDTVENLEAYKKLLSGWEEEIPSVFPVAAVTMGREGNELADIEALKPLVAGFSDDGNCLQNLGLLKEALSHDVMVMLHCGIESDVGGYRDTDEPKWVERYLGLRRDEKGGIMYFQHISRAESVKLIRQAKAEGIGVFAETCPHYFSYTRDELATPVNPPIGNLKDLEAVRWGLMDGTIDVIATDYAPLPQPKKTGIAGFRSFLPLSYGLVLQGVLIGEQLKEKLCSNPEGILELAGAELDIQQA